MSEHDELIEALADYAHVAWAGWKEYEFRLCREAMESGEPLAPGYLVIPANLVSRWTRQMNTPYADLPENEKESDRVEARKMLDIFLQPQRSNCKERGDYAEALEREGEG